MSGTKHEDASSYERVEIITVEFVSHTLSSVCVLIPVIVSNIYVGNASVQHT